MDVGNPMVWLWSAVIFVVVALSIWKFGMVSYGTGLKVVFTVVSAPIIFFVTAVVADR